MRTLLETTMENSDSKFKPLGLINGIGKKISHGVSDDVINYS
jgi:hypothetical protein